MNTKEFDSAGYGNIAQEYGDIGVKFLNIGFKNEGLFAYCKDTLNNYHAIKLEHKHLKCDNNQLDSCLYGKLDEYLGVLDIVIFKTTSINDILSNKIVEIGEKIYDSDPFSAFGPFDYQFQINTQIQLQEFNKYSIVRIDENYVAIMHLPENIVCQYMILADAIEYDIPVYNLGIDAIINEKIITINDYLDFQKKQKNMIEEYYKNLFANIEDNSIEIEDDDNWDSFNSEEKMHLDPDRWMNEMLNEADLSYENEWEKEEFEYNKNNQKSTNDNIEKINSILLIGIPNNYDFESIFPNVVLWVPSNISFTLKDEIYLIDLLQYKPEVSVADEPDKYDYEYGRYKNVFVFIISKKEIERHKQLEKNEEIDNLGLLLNNIKLDYDLDFITLTSESDSSYIFTSYIKPTLYKENIKKDNLPF